LEAKGGVEHFTHVKKGRKKWDFSSAILVEIGLKTLLV